MQLGHTGECGGSKKGGGGSRVVGASERGGGGGRRDNKRGINREELSVPQGQAHKNDERKEN